MINRYHGFMFSWNGRDKKLKFSLAIVDSDKLFDNFPKKAFVGRSNSTPISSFKLLSADTI